MERSVIFILLLFAVCGNAYGVPHISRAHSNLTAILLKSCYKMQTSPAQTAYCFQYYSPKLIALTQQYETDYNACSNLTAQEEAELKQRLEGDVQFIQNSSDSISYQFNDCSNTSSSLYNLFECYNNAADFAAQTASNLQSLSSNKMKLVQISEAILTYNGTHCTEECFKVYNEESLKVNAELEECLEGIPITTTTTTTTQPTTTVEPDITTLTTTANIENTSKEEPIALLN